VRVLAVDPGREKCGIAACAPGQVLAHRVVPTPELGPVARQWASTYRVDVAVVGGGTGASTAAAGLAGLSVPVVVVGERGTTLEARRRYFLDHPPRGWARLVPKSLLLPPEPYDDYAAILLAERYLETRGAPP
jgi:RNase H-fold protein (predicted Holliday junction resolvase)